MFGSKFIRTFSTTVLRRGQQRRPLGMRARLLAIVLIPSVALLGIGIGAAVYLVNDGREAKSWAEFASQTTAPAVTMIEAFELERGASMIYMAGVPGVTDHLAATRRDADTALTSLQSRGEPVAVVRPELTGDLSGIDRLYKELPLLRQAIDARALPAEQVFAAYNAILDTIVQGTLLAAKIAPNAQIAVDLYRAVHPLRAAEAIARSASIGTAGLLTNSFTAAQLSEFTRYVGDARGEVAYASGALSGARQAELKAITDSPAWRQMTEMEDAMIRRGEVTADSESSSGSGSSSSSSSSGSNSNGSSSNGSSGAGSTGGSTSASTNRRAQTAAEALPMSAQEWGNAATEVRSKLLQVWNGQSHDSHVAAEAVGEKQASDSLWGGIAVGVVTLLAFLAALYLANRLVGRMRRLRSETLQLADERLPNTIRDLSDGQDVASEADLNPLDFGRDEIGQVADAFNRAHSAAVAAAVAESKTRSGVNAVFLNIAHRSQVMVHRQLALLDRAEREEENPGKLDILFQLDHLATRARRNAENLIILGGEKPGRRWRNPVPLIDVLRSAVAESLDYTRIHTGRLPDVRIVGTSVADLIHLVAELTDNATAFSPPESRVEISGNVVGKGIAIEISDQGLGMSQLELDERNALLADPPDFSVAALSSDARLGLFVVAKLATRHKISVRLSESDYGGVRAIVLVPNTLLASDGNTAEQPAIPPQAALEPAAVAAARVASEHAAPGRGEAAAPLPPGPDKPALPRRRRAVIDAPSAGPVTEPPPRPRSADEARSLMSAIENGTKQGRLNRVDGDAPTQRFDREDGTGDHFRTP